MPLRNDTTGRANSYYENWKFWLPLPCMPIHISLCMYWFLLVTFVVNAYMLTPFINSYPKSEVERFWKMVCLVQFHDVLPGSAIEMVYDDVLRVRRVFSSLMLWLWNIISLMPFAYISADAHRSRYPRNCDARRTIGHCTPAGCKHLGRQEGQVFSSSEADRYIVHLSNLYLSDLVIPPLPTCRPRCVQLFVLATYRDHWNPSGWGITYHEAILGIWKNRLCPWYGLIHSSKWLTWRCP